MINKENFDEWIETQGVASYDEKVQQFIKYLSELDTTEFMTPTQREIAQLPADEFQVEYELVIKKESSRSAAQRKYIIERYEQEQNAAREATAEQDSSNA
jgi:hypothetical protein